MIDCIKCYRCESIDTQHKPYQCNEYFDDSNLEPESCDDVHNAQYCIKQIGNFEVMGINCFQCSSAWNISCTDLLISDGTLLPKPCDYIYDAKYCIKMTGGLMTRRFCSSHYLGNYCNYVKQPGDKMEYRSCYFTCSGDGCNSAHKTTISFSFYAILFFILSYFYY
ncbi:conserved hypothetical protein [Pediculus humanus corporis]|uniref:Protein quiver n=1 Tax=Pediculus humanus subsp. corporis TaxID=121224 RepID=E0VE32_PEDHC|nr:uncharacterized protein Phum_PHUM128010 [Pediculus humanus corporis]EEB11638.1 conserved hypothetical protein [Pediculus humanus corporis]